MNHKKSGTVPYKIETWNDIFQAWSPAKGAYQTLSDAKASARLIRNRKKRIMFYDGKTFVELCENQNI